MTLSSPILRLQIQTVIGQLQLGDISLDNPTELLLATCAQESHLGQFRTQLGGGPARGIFQMEGEDHDDIWLNYIIYHPLLKTALVKLSPSHTTDDMVDNDDYAIAMARVHYERCRGNLPAATSLYGLWTYYKHNYNTMQGAATQDEFFNNYKTYITDGVAK